MGNAVSAAKHPAGAIAHAIAGRIGTRRLCGFQHEIERDAETAAKLPVATGACAEFMVPEIEGKARLGDLDASELDAADRVPFADRRPAVAAG